MKIKCAQLLATLKTAMPGLSEKDSQKRAFIFARTHVLAHSEEISIKVPLAGLDVEGVVQSDKLFKFLSEIDGGIELDVAVDENEIKFVAGRARAGFALQRESAFFSSNTDEIKKLNEIEKKLIWQHVPAEFTEAIAFALAIVSKNMRSSHFVLTCINLRPSGCIEASDNLRISRYQINPLPIKKAVLLPCAAARELIKHELSEMAESPGRLHLRNAAMTLSCCVPGDDSVFPNTDEITELNADAVSIIFPEAAKAVLSRAQVFIQNDDELENEASIQFMSGKLLVSVKDATGWFKEAVKAQHDVAGCSFFANPGFLKTILEKKLTCQVDSRRIKFTGEKWMHLISLKASKN